MIMLIGGCGALLLGGLLAIIAASSLRQSQTNPNYSWGPGAYVFNLLEGFVYTALVLVPAGAALVLVGWRRLRSRRTTVGSSEARELAAAMEKAKAGASPAAATHSGETAK